MNNQNIQLNIGDKIGFVIYAAGLDGNDKTLFFPVVEITERDGERAYFYEYPDGSRSSAAICQSHLVGHALEIEPRGDPKMICLSDRKAEFRSAMKRGQNHDLQVYPDFEKDSFIVVNRTNETKYPVRFETRADRKNYVFCGCKDFQYKKRLCKHAAEVLQDTFFGVVESFGVELNG